MLLLKELISAPPAITTNHSHGVKNDIKNEDFLKKAYIIAATLYGEARGEGHIGMSAIMNVIMNRSHGDFNNAMKVVLKPKQFSMWNGVKDPYEYAMKLAKHRNKSFNDAIDIVNSAIEGKLHDITDGSLFYFNPKIVTPSWAKKLEFKKKIGNHNFYGLRKI